jgi:hypothetical protein
MTRIERINTDLIGENPLNPRHPRAIPPHKKSNPIRVAFI